MRSTKLFIFDRTRAKPLDLKKEEIRESFLERRRALSPGELTSISEAICDGLFTNFQLEGKKISLFLPIEKKYEINTYQILDKALSIGAQVAVPKTNFKTSDLKHIQIDDQTQLEISEFGIPEPQKGKVISAEHLDVVIVPLLAADQRGYRVGYGKGFYDRFMKKCSPRAIFIGITHFDDLIPEIEDIHAKDVRLHACITPNNIYRFEH